ncbi:MAG: Heat shock protein 70, partial [bacterium]
EYIAHSPKDIALHIRREVKRHEFEEIIEEKLKNTLALIDKALKDAELEANQIDRVLLVGGSTRSPIVWDLVTQHMGQEPHIEIDPDAAVALGAAVQAGIIAGEEIDAILVDVTPMSLGIAAAEISFAGQLIPDQFAPLIRRNTTIPVQHSKVFSTIYPGQDKIHIQVYQGEEETASDNVLLGDFFIEDLKPNREMELTDVTVNFSLDINAILDVTVIERKTGKEVRKQLKASRQRLSSQDIASSQAKIAAVYEQDEIDEDDETGEIDDLSIEIDPGTKALLERAIKILSKENLSADLASKISVTVEKIKDSLAEDDSEQTELYCDELIDWLIEAEE